METRNFEAGASASPPSAPASPSTGYPTNGNPATATPATKPGEFWFYKIGEELRSVITVLGGLTPSDSVLTQVKDAILGGGAYSIGANGYVKLPSWLGGLVVQWGSVTVTAGTQSTVTFPIAFPNTIFGTWCTVSQALTTATAYASTQSVSLSQIKVQVNSGISGAGTYWLAIGN